MLVCGTASPIGRRKRLSDALRAIGRGRAAIGRRKAPIGRPSGYRVSDIGHGLWARGESSIKNRSSGRFFLHMSEKSSNFASKIVQYGLLTL